MGSSSCYRTHSEPYLWWLKTLFAAVAEASGLFSSGSFCSSIMRSTPVMANRSSSSPLIDRTGSQLNVSLQFMILQRLFVGWTHIWQTIAHFHGRHIVAYVGCQMVKTHQSTSTTRYPAHPKSISSQASFNPFPPPCQAATDELEPSENVPNAARLTSIFTMKFCTVLEEFFG